MFRSGHHHTCKSVNVRAEGIIILAIGSPKRTSFLKLCGLFFYFLIFSTARHTLASLRSQPSIYCTVGADYAVTLEISQNIGMVH